MENYVVTLPPPTPNGDLHLGHLAGPFLAADVFVKRQLAAGNQVFVFSYSDSNQSYVQATAERLGLQPDELAEANSKRILQTLKKYHCTLDDYFQPNPSSNNFTHTFIERLYKRGQITVQPHPFFFSPNQKRFLGEAEVSGNCVNCLDECKCGICETCGHINDASSILNGHLTADPTEPLQVRTPNVLVLRLEDFKAELSNFHDFSEAIRPRFRWLVHDALAGPLPNFPITVPGDWGIDFVFPEREMAQVINPWAEVQGQLLFGFAKLMPRWETFKIVNFFGFDNSYFYALVHAALLIASDNKQYLPHATVINEFYNLEHQKFSSSKGHALWAIDAVDTEAPVDLLRLYLCLSAPGFEQGNYDFAAYKEILEIRFLKPLCTALQNWNNSELSPISSKRSNLSFAGLFAGLELHRFDLRRAAERCIYGIQYIAKLNASNNSNQAGTLFLAWANAVQPIMPNLSKRLRTALKSGTPLPSDPTQLLSGISNDF